MTIHVKKAAPKLYSRIARKNPKSDVSKGEISTFSYEVFIAQNTQSLQQNVDKQSTDNKKNETSTNQAESYFTQIISLLNTHEVNS